jgi:hypothetical protein
VTTSYLISITTATNDVQIILAILNIAGKGQAFHGFSNDATNTALWIIPRGRKNSQEVTTQLQKMPGILSVSVVTLSTPVQKNELTEVRSLFSQIGWDSSQVTDKALSVFINAKLQGQYTYYVDYDHRAKTPIKIQIKPIEEHPHFSPDWLKTNAYNEDEDRELTMDDLEIRSITLEMIEHEAESPPLPPPPDSK